MSDVAEQERLREALIRAEHDLAQERKARAEADAMLGGLARIASAGSVADMDHKIVATARELFACEHAALLVEARDGSLEAASAVGDTLARSRWAPRALFARVLAGQPVAVFDTGSIPEWMAQPEAVRALGSALHVPLVTRRRRAVLVAAQRDRSAFSPRDVELARRLVAIVVPFLSGVEAHETERERIAAEERAAVLEAQRSILEEQLETIQKQKDQIARLVAPAIPVWPGVLLVPLVGTLDAEDAESATERVLTAMTAQRASEVIVDVTGLEGADDQLAARLQALVSAVGFMGAQARLSGMRPELAWLLSDRDASFASTSVVERSRDRMALRTALTLGDALRDALVQLGFDVRRRSG